MVKKRWRDKNREHSLEVDLQRRKERWQTDPLFKLKICARSHVRTALRRRRTKKSEKTLVFLGCSYEHLKSHLESQWLEGMTWENYGNHPMDWQIDHRIPLASATDLPGLMALLHFSNLQPMWKVDNLAKGDKMPHELIA